VLRELEQTLPELGIGEEVWGRARDLARRCRRAGVSVPATGPLSAACAHHHGTRIEHEDADFDAIERVAGRAGSG
jgi:predicted nucleic acid-binding protein